MNRPVPEGGLLFRRLSYLAVMTAMVTLTLSEAAVLQPGVTLVAAAVPLLYLVGVLGAGVTGWVLSERPGREVLNHRKSVWLVLGIACFVTAEYFLRESGDWIVALAHFLILVQLVKLFGRKTKRDYWQIYLISLVHVSVASVVTSDVVFAAGLLVYSVLMMWTLVLFHFRCQVELMGGESEVQTEAGKSGGVERVLSRRFGLTLVGILAVLWGSNVLFFILSPRLQQPLVNFARTGLGRTALTGFGDTMRLGEMGTIVENHAPVMHVTMTCNGEPYQAADEKDLEWRGTTLQFYDGRTWMEKGPGFNIQEGARPGGLPIQMGQTRPTDIVVQQSILLEPTGERTLFALSRPIELRSPRIRQCLYRGVDDALIMLGHASMQPLRYDVWSVRGSWGTEPKEEETDLGPMGFREGGPLRKITPRLLQRQAYLQLPYEVKESVRSYARQAAGDPGLGPRTRAEMIEEELRSHYGYTLEMESTQGVEPVEYFLFTRKKGHCEYFAAAMVVMLRSVDIPARVVTGFKGGEWNDIGGWYVVRQSDAHAWVEAWIDGEGWVSFDPTPPGERQQVQSARGFGWLGRWKDYLYNRWMLHVFQYDRAQQDEVYQRAGQAAGRVRGFMRGLGTWVSNLLGGLRRALFDPGFMNSALGMVVLGGTLIVSAVLGVLIYLGGRRLLRRFKARPRKIRRPGTGTAWFYSEMLKILRRKGLQRSQETTPYEFAYLAAALLGEQAGGSVASITEVFCRFRYGGNALDEGDRRRVREELDRLKQEVKGKKT